MDAGEGMDFVNPGIGNAADQVRLGSGLWKVVATTSNTQVIDHGARMKVSHS